MFYGLQFRLGMYGLRGIVVSGGTERILSEEEIFEWNKTHATARNLSDYFNGYILSRYAREHDDNGKLIRQFGYAIFKKDSDTEIRLFPELGGSGPMEQTYWTGYKREDGKVYLLASYGGYFERPYYRITTAVAVALLEVPRNSWFETEDYLLKTKGKK